jgi:hypothetical protein
MEIIIILLIAVEVTIVLIREGHELAEGFRSYFTSDKLAREAWSDANKSETALLGNALDMAKPRLEDVGGNEERRLV